MGGLRERSVVVSLAAPDVARTVVTALGYIPPIPTEDLNPAHPHVRGSPYVGRGSFSDQGDGRNSGAWSEMDISDLTNELARGRRWRKPPAFFAETRTRFERRLNLGLVDGPRKEKPRRSGA